MTIDQIVTNIENTVQMRREQRSVCRFETNRRPQK